MRMIGYEFKKLWRMTGLRRLILAILALNLLAVLFGNLSEPDVTASEMHVENYADNIAYVIRTAERNREEYTFTAGEDSYLVRYQEQVICRYAALLEKEVAPHPVRGWNAFFDHGTDDLLLMALALLIGAALTMAEQDGGTHTLLRLTPHGHKAYLGKLALLCLFALALPWLVNGGTAIGVAMRFGLSSPAAPLCSVIRFTYCTADVSVLSYLALSSLLKSLAVLALSLFSAWVASVSASYLVSFSLASGVLLVGFGLSQNNGGFSLLNPYALALADPLWERYRAWALWGHSVPLLGTAVVVSAVICAGLSLFLLLCPLQNAARPFERLQKTISRKWTRLYEKCRSLVPRRRPRRRSLLFSEAKKSLIHARLLLLCAVMLIAKLGYAEATAFTPSSNEIYYEQVCRTLEGELTEEKRTMIGEALAQSNAVLARESNMRSAMSSGLITGEEYSAYLDEHARASQDKYVYERLSVQCQRIDAATARGQKAYIVYDSGWNAALSHGEDGLLFAFLSLFFCGIYAFEYKCGMDRTAKVTARGLSFLHKIKLTLAVTVAAIAFTVFLCVDWAILLRTFPLPRADFPLASVRETALSLPLWLSLSLSCAWQLLKALVLSVSVCLSARVFKRVYLSLPVALFGAFALSLLP